MLYTHRGLTRLPDIMSVLSVISTSFHFLHKKITEVMFLVCLFVSLSLLCIHVNDEIVYNNSCSLE